MMYRESDVQRWINDQFAAEAERSPTARGSRRADCARLALIAAYLRGDLEALDSLVDDDDAGELLVMVTEVS